MSDFDCVHIIPRYSEVERKDINLSSSIFDVSLDVPILSSPMDTVSGLDMLKAIREVGGLGIHHRYCDLDTLTRGAMWGGIAVSPSMELRDLQDILAHTEFKIAVLDVAHGHTKRNLEFAKNLKIMGWNVIGGNICTRDAAEDYLKIGVIHVRVGIGSGSVCTTREVTGVGRPQYMAIPEIRNEFNDDICIISDGGCRTTGDIAKAFALGADYVMLGRMLAETYEAKNDGIYCGMASAPALRRRGKEEFFVEGKTSIIEVKGSVRELMKNIKKALETTCYYTGSKSLMELDGLYGYE